MNKVAFTGSVEYVNKVGSLARCRYVSRVAFTGSVEYVNKVGSLARCRYVSKVAFTGSVDVRGQGGVHWLGGGTSLLSLVLRKVCPNWMQMFIR